MRRVPSASPSEVIVRGFCIGIGKFEYPISHETRAFIVKERSRPLSPSSRPIFEMLAGERNWTSTRNRIETYEVRANAKHRNIRSPLRLIVPTLEEPALAIAISHSIEQNVVPGVILQARAGKWTAKATVLHRESLEAATLLRFESSSMTALLKLSENAFRSILASPEKASSRLKYLCETGEDFLPEPPDYRRWTIAELWPDWQHRLLGFAARARELAVLEQTNELAENTFRQMCWQMGLIRNDNSDI